MTTAASGGNTMGKKSKRKSASQDVPRDDWSERRAFLTAFIAQPLNTGSDEHNDASDGGAASSGPDEHTNPSDTSGGRHPSTNQPDLTPDDATLAKVREKLELPPTDHTIGAARTSIPGLEAKGYFGVSSRLRGIAKQPRLDALYGEDRPIKSPNQNPQKRDHAEEDMLNAIHKDLERLGLSDTDLEGHVIDVLISKDDGVCTTCSGGLLSYKYKDGVIKQFSMVYPTLTLRISAQGGNALQFTPVIDGKVVDKSRKVLIVRNGEMVDE
ncbi:MAG: hypothetical protein AAFY52_09890 [Pseudomonadota bacterium]